MLKCGFTVGQSWHGLKKAWIAYHLSKEEEDVELMKLYASVIQKIQRQLGIRITEFPEIKFYGFGEEFGFLPERWEFRMDKPFKRDKRSF